MIQKIAFYLLILFHLLLFSCKTVSVGSEKGVSKEVTSNNTDNSDVFLNAHKELILGNIQQAQQLFEKSLEINPKDAASMFELARIYISRREFDAALGYLEKAKTIEPQNVYYLSLYASLLQLQDKHMQAAKVYEEIIRLKPNSPENYDNLAYSYLSAGKPAEAIRIYEELEDRLGVSEEYSMKKQTIYLQENKIDEAVAEIEKLIEIFPREIKYYAILAEMYLANGMNDKALEAYDKVRQIDPDDPYIHISLADYYKKTGEEEKAFESLIKGFENPKLEIDFKISVLLRYYSINEIYSDLKEEAFTLAKAMIKAHPNDPKAYSMYGDFMFQDKQYELARDAFYKVISLDNSKYIVWEQLLFTESELNEADSLLKTSLQAIELFPEQPIPYLFAGSAHYIKKNWAECVSVLEDGLFYVVGNNLLLEQIYAYLGDAYNQLANHQKSDEAYEKVLTLNPNNDYVLNNYAYYLSLRNENLEKAAGMAKLSVDLKPGSANLDTYGWVLYKLGDYEEAGKWIVKAMEAGGNENPVILEHYGDVLWYLDRKQEAIQWWKKALDAGKGSDFLEKKVEDQMMHE
jgi:tetratricopeptide (TPR) repeat protein